MRHLFILGALLALVSRAAAAVEADPVLLQGLQALESQSNGAQAACQIWYQDRPHLATEMETKVFALTKELGTMVGSEVLATQRLSARDVRYYVAIYYERRPLWMMIERYLGKDVGKDKPLFLPLRISLDPDEILPSFLAEFHS